MGVSISPGECSRDSSRGDVAKTYRVIYSNVMRCGFLDAAELSSKSPAAASLLSRSLGGIYWSGDGSQIPTYVGLAHGLAPEFAVEVIATPTPDAGRRRQGARVIVLIDRRGALHCWHVHGQR